MQDKLQGSLSKQIQQQIQYLMQQRETNLIPQLKSKLDKVVADHVGHKKWAQNVSLLQRGLAVAADQCHERGLAAFLMLPKSLEMSMGMQQQTQILTDDTLTQGIDIDEDQASVDEELRMSVRESINRLVIPSLRKVKLARCLTLLICFILPVVGLTVFVPIFSNSLLNPVDYLFTISVLRMSSSCSAVLFIVRLNN